MINLYLSFLYLLFSLYVQQNIKEIGTLPKQVRETSGLIFYNGKLITHNDSDNTPQLFELDTGSLSITRTVTLNNVKNMDWEDIAQDENYIYVGDFGNYKGDRKNLSIYRIPKSAYNTAEKVQADRIAFSYEDQVDFTSKSRSDWDAESLFVFGNQLVVLTKQWESNGTRAYTVPKVPGNYKAKNIGGYDIRGLVTGAEYNPLTRVLYLIGYNQMLFPFIARVDGLQTDNIFSGTVKRTDLKIGFAQVEGIARVGANRYFFSNEFMVNPLVKSPARLFVFSTSDDQLLSVDNGD
ncbi:T9SS C-terminal target domain-containing protein [Flavobacteriaceae bacterium F89]|uniref:T9SS C-terminal target domain-containing protein n=1 Tax=Cerina litoralis TaxID=2874477 RepID=A0AAE3JS40_9FLAO|nr:T9SS C-terminal target domain-containing protein [Cerina litoralis]MCG2462028.1 T9SS C-terminal target domain-containing protein [Cerina litoralis]